MLAYINESYICAPYAISHAAHTHTHTHKNKPFMQNDNRNPWIDLKPNSWHHRFTRVYNMIKRWNVRESWQPLFTTTTQAKSSCNTNNNNSSSSSSSNIIQLQVPNTIFIIQIYTKISIMYFIAPLFSLFAPSSFHICLVVMCAVHSSCSLCSASSCSTNKQKYKMKNKYEKCGILYTLKHTHL